MSSSKIHTYLLWFILSLSLGTRLIFFFYTGARLNPILHDEYIYDELGQNIAQGKGLSLTYVPDRPAFNPNTKIPALHPFTPGYFYNVVKLGTPTAFWPPLYPLFLGIVYKSFSHQIWIPVLVQIILGTIACYLLYQIGVMVFHPPVGLIAGFLAALYPFSIYYEDILMSESLFIFFIVFFAYCYYRAKEKHTLWGYILVGICFGLCFLTRPIIFYFLPVLLFFVILDSGFRNYRNAFWVILTVGLIIFPWVLRNDFLFGKPILFPTSGGYTLHRYIQEFLWELPTDPINISPQTNQIRTDPVFTSESEMQRNIILYQTSETFLKIHPIFFLRYFLNHLAYSLTPYHSRTATSLSKISSLLTYGIIFCLSIPGILLSWKRHPSSRFLIVLIIFYICINALVVGGIRFRIPIDTFLILFSAYTIYKIYQRGSGILFNNAFISLRQV